MTEHARAEHVDHVPLDFEDPHRAALEDNPENAERPPLRTLLAVMVSYDSLDIPPGLLTEAVKQFLALSYVCPIGCGFFLISAILVPVGTELGDTQNIAWIVSGWSTASSVSFSIAGKVSDIFGRRWTILVGEVICIVGCVRPSLLLRSRFFG